MSTEVIDVQGAAKSYRTPAGEFPALRGVDLSVAPGEFVAVTGRSGSGKSTLLNLLAGIDRPTSGRIRVAGTEVHTLPESRLSSWRGRNVGMVFQFFQLLPTLTVAENVMLPMDFCATRPPRERRPRAMELLDLVGIADHADKMPSALSGGQQQRAAIARALANDPPVLLADEPTGNLDSATTDVILSMFTARAAAGTAIVMVTHERDLSGWAHRQVHLADGRVVAEAAR
ncbi:ABC transporter ATP-binding protein [Sinosporangium siamense]|uniref:ABC transporter ATP-binding protein n=1 Tax=Sinosporangium siamense TaxID=1367973 RepID=A0A919RFD6_9ACTN|nr:ABC transporter ATP-binding protein [Sinosporangium siamense]GII90759.1 ABC transporter ATP-binding protein [Sinosporangium siamense]